VGLGNVASVRNMLRRLGADAVTASSPGDVQRAAALVLPGVGAYDTGVARLREAGIFDIMANLPEDFPLLGICLGMQLLGLGSEEGSREGLGRVDARFVKFPDMGLAVPHMGWNHVTPTGDDRLMAQLPDAPRFYFTHSYYAVCGSEDDAIAEAHYGIDFTAAYRSRNTYGVQFHPEKSHRFGMEFLRAWMANAC
jgi:glutamine amidotransferase